ncbi:MAG TPA: N-acetylmuramoyl-L-alanine amidase, partial [Devosia sp.]|nr:N-acetylmuramoyl-L-alanine amidase [Devosia sp.]
TFVLNAQADRDAFEKALQGAGGGEDAAGVPDEEAGAETTAADEIVAADAQSAGARSVDSLAGGEEGRAVVVPASVRPLILIDPGHGGIDGGAKAASGLEEKTVTLQFAQALRDALIETGRFEVALTRENDTFFRLEQRVQLARDNRADLFISIHADSFEDTSIRGASVYIRDEQATDVLDKVLAENENKADLLAGFPVETEQRQVVDLLVELMRREMRRLSFMAANAIVGELKNSVRVRRFPMRRADFFVLQSPDVPAILLELGFLSNLSDVENFSSPAWRKRAAEAVVRGIGAYFEQTRQ